MRELLVDGSGGVERFLVGWYGEPEREVGVVPDGVEALPPPLREWFAVTSRWDSLPWNNEVLTPERGWVEDGFRVFWRENQNVWLWAAEDGGDDPAVYDRENRDGEPWRPTGLPLSAFLVRVAVFEAVMAAEHAAATCWVDSAQLDAILRPMAALPGPEWRWPGPGHRFYAGDGLIAFAGTNFDPDDPEDDTPHHEVWVAAREPKYLDYLTDLSDVEWDVPPGGVDADWEG